ELASAKVGSNAETLTSNSYNTQTNFTIANTIVTAVPDKAQCRMDAAEGPSRNAGISAPSNANPPISFTLYTAPKPSTTNVPVQIQQRRCTSKELLNSMTAHDSQPSKTGSDPSPSSHDILLCFCTASFDYGQLHCVNGISFCHCGC
ncbi:MAG: hypothetical protein ALECFALPRED_009889, partial [Alectoria fallacina]